MADPAGMGAVVISYLAALAVSMPLSGWLGQRFGPRITFAAAVSVFLAGSVGAGLAANLPLLVAARAIQGLGGGVLIPLALATVLVAFPEELRQRASAIVAAPAAVAPALGPILGGLIPSGGDWRWIFFINVPVGVLCVVGGLRFLPDQPRSRERFDTVGWVLASIGVLGVVIGLSIVESALPLGLVAVALGAAAIASLVVYERRVRSPLIPLTLFARRPFAVGLSVMLVASIAFSALIFTLPVARQDQLGESAVESGFVLPAHAVGIIVITPLAPRLVSRLGARLVLLAGMALCAAATLVIALNVAASPWLTALQLAIAGVGFGLSIVPLQTVPFQRMDDESIGRGTPLLSLVRQIGAAIGPAAAAAGIAIGRGGGESASFVTALLNSAGFAALGAAIATLTPRS